ncbi:MAG: GntP family permease [Bacillota bacterium]
MEVLAIVLSLVGLMYFAYRGFNVILFAPVFALLAAAFSGWDVMPAYTELFMIKMVSYIKSFFPLFMLGAVFGKIMDATGAAKAIAHWIVGKLGPSRAIISVVLSCAILTYGGVSLFVVAFAVYPLAAAIFREGNIPKRLIPASIALGSFTFTMTALPGSPQIQNAIPIKYFGTTTWAAPATGILAALIMLIGGLTWLEYRRKKAMAAGEGYGNHTKQEPEKKIDETPLPSALFAILPLAVVLVLNFFLSRSIPTWDNAMMNQVTALKLPLAVTSVKAAAGNWALIISLVTGIVAALALMYKQIKGKIAQSTNDGTIGSLLAVMNTASEVGYGNVISSLAGFSVISGALAGLKANPLFAEAVSVNLLAGITGSASGGMSIALETMGKQFLEWANAANISPEVLHRIASISSGGFDTMPHNGAVITLFAITGLTHKESYIDLMIVSLVIPVLSGLVGILWYMATGIA